MVVFLDPPVLATDAYEEFWHVAEDDVSVPDFDADEWLQDSDDDDVPERNVAAASVPSVYQRPGKLAIRVRSSDSHSNEMRLSHPCSVARFASRSACHSRHAEVASGRADSAFSRSVIASSVVKPHNLLKEAYENGPF